MLILMCVIAQSPALVGTQGEEHTNIVRESGDGCWALSQSKHFPRPSATLRSETAHAHGAVRGSVDVGETDGLVVLVVAGLLGRTLHVRAIRAGEGGAERVVSSQGTEGH